MRLKKAATKTWKLLKKTATEFNEDHGIKLSASLAYYTIFSIAPLSIIILSVCGVFFGKDAVSGQFYRQIKNLVGDQAAIQIQETIKNMELSNNNFFAMTVGIAILLVGASGVFAEIQSSINYIWGLRAKPKRGLSKFLLNRLMSFSMIGVMGFLLLVSLVANTILDLINDKLIGFLPNATVYLLYALNFTVVLAIITLLFAVIFKTLPDGKLAWKDTLIGSGVTAVLFMLGKFGISFYLGTSAVASAYGAAGSVVIILVWVYYSAIILYFGAEFTKVYATMYGKSIVPNGYAVTIQKEVFEIEDDATAGQL
ncbi:MAG: YihY/virulence factor BrkB family protein [Flavobacterium sp.]